MRKYTFIVVIISLVFLFQNCQQSGFSTYLNGFVESSSESPLNLKSIDFENDKTKEVYSRLINPEVKKITVTVRAEIADVDSKDMKQLVANNINTAFYKLAHFVDIKKYDLAVIEVYPGVYKSNIASVSGDSLKIPVILTGMVEDGSPGVFRPVNRIQESAKIIFDGENKLNDKNKSFFAYIQPDKNGASSVVIRGITIQNYAEGITLDGNKLTYSYDGNVIEKIRFIKNGNKLFKENTSAYAVLRFFQVGESYVVGNKFIENENRHIFTDVNVEEKSTLLHAIYFANETHDNVIEKNEFKKATGDFIRVRNFSNFNVVKNNFFQETDVLQAGAVSTWHDRTVEKLECSSIGNSVEDNIISTRSQPIYTHTPSSFIGVDCESVSLTKQQSHCCEQKKKVPGRDQLKDILYAESNKFNYKKTIKLSPEQAPLVVTDGNLLPEFSQGEAVVSEFYSFDMRDGTFVMFNTAVGKACLHSSIKYGENDNLIWYSGVRGSNEQNDYKDKNACFLKTDELFKISYLNNQSKPFLQLSYYFNESGLQYNFKANGCVIYASYCPRMGFDLFNRYKLDNNTVNHSGRVSCLSKNLLKSYNDSCSMDGLKISRQYKAFYFKDGVQVDSPVEYLTTP